jgi:hypothetical protein
MHRSPQPNPDLFSPRELSLLSASALARRTHELRWIWFALVRGQDRGIYPRAAAAYLFARQLLARRGLQACPRCDGRGYVVCRETGKPPSPPFDGERDWLSRASSPTASKPVRPTLANSLVRRRQSGSPDVGKVIWPAWQAISENTTKMKKKMARSAPSSSSPRLQGPT